MELQTINYDDKAISQNDARNCGAGNYPRRIRAVRAVLQGNGFESFQERRSGALRRVKACR
jgi:hypothetical protein